MRTVPASVTAGPKSRPFLVARACVAEDRRVPALIVAVLTAFVAWRWALPAAFGSGPYTWDAAGHLSAAETLRDRFWPWPTGWDPGFFGGWQQGRFYPPLTHWIVATLGKFAPIESAFAAVVGGAAIATPYAAYRFARGRRAAPAVAALFALFFTAVLAAPPEVLRMPFAPGGTFHSTFEAGLVTNGTGLLLFLLGGASFPAALGRGARVVPAAAWLAAGVCNHLVAGAALAALFVADVAARAAKSNRRRSVVRRGLVVATAGAALSAWWWAPMIFDDGYRRISHVAAESGPIVSTTLALAVGAYALGAATRPRVALAASGAAVFAAAVVLGAALGEASRGSAHFYRFATFAAAGALLPAACGPSRRTTRLVAGLLGGAFLAAFAVHGGPASSARSAPPISVPSELGPEDRLLAATHVGHEFSAHYLAFETPRRSGAQGALGLFVESSPLSGHVMELARATVFDEFSWGVPVNLGNAARLATAVDDRHGGAPEAREAARARMKRLYDLFGITHVVTNRRPPPEITPFDRDAPIVASIPARAEPRGDAFEHREGAYVFRAYPVEPRPAFAEVVTTPMTAFDASDGDAWDRAVEDALFGEAEDAPLPVADRPGLDLAPGAPAVTRTFRDPSGARFTIEIESEDPRPVLVKTAWHPNWTARGADGTAIPVDRVAPGYCLVRAAGTVELAWRRSPFERGAAAASTLALGFGWILLVPRRRWRTKL